VPGAYFFFLSTRDGSKTWQQVMYTRNDDPVDPACEKIKSLNSDSYWVWMGWQLAVTHDAGKTWQLWDTSEISSGRRVIKDIIFEDERNGYLILDPLHQNEPSLLYTRDGGKTWAEKGK
jgi:photosystem II stability/assembly factor-like uncharacterized protein